MSNFSLSDLPLIFLSAIPIILAITLHEAAHGFAALQCGDATAKKAGRISLNPIVHIDLIGTILLPGGLFLLSTFLGGQAFIFGWAKPVPVNFGALNHPKRDMRYVAFAGPFVNLLMAVFWAAFLKILLVLGLASSQAMLMKMGAIGLQINLALMIINLFPLPPLDGGRIAVSLLPMPFAHYLARLEPFGMIIFIGLFVSKIIQPALYFLLDQSFETFRLFFQF